MRFTKERLEEIAEDGFLKHGESKELARMALAGMGAEPVADVVAWSHPTEERTCDIRWRRHDVSPGPLYTAPQPLTTSERAELENYRNAQQVVPGDEKWVKATHSEVQELARIAQAGMVAVPDEAADHRDAFEAVFPIPLHAERCGAGYCCTAYNAWDAHRFVNRWDGWNACRAAMQGKAEPVSQPYKLPENSFTNEDLEGMVHGNNPRANAYRELLAFRRNSPMIPEELISAMEEVLRISDRDHDAWHRAKNAIKAFRDR